jgi:predicted nuclease with TOPRIM domain
MLVVIVAVSFLAYSTIARFQNDQSSLQSKYDLLNSQYSSLLANYSALQTDFDRVQAQFASLQNDYDDLQTLYDNSASQYASLSSQYGGLSSQFNNLQSQLSDLQGEHSELRSQYTSLQPDYANLQANYSSLNTTYAQLVNDYQQLLTKLPPDKGIRIDAVNWIRDIPSSAGITDVFVRNVGVSNVTVISIKLFHQEVLQSSNSFQVVIPENSTYHFESLDLPTSEFNQSYLFEIRVETLEGYSATSDPLPLLA